LRIDVVEFHDHRRFYQFDVQLPCRPLSGLSRDEDSVWALQTEHQVVEKNINFRTYNHRDASAWLDGEVDHSRRATTTYGEAYHYADPYTVLDDPLALDEDLTPESGYFYARLHHERYLNGQTRLSGVSSSTTLAPGQVLNISGGAPQAFAPGAVIIGLTTRAARDASFEATFKAMPYTDHVCFRPPLPAKPQIAGTLPARVTRHANTKTYADLDENGGYTVRFLFDRDTWEAGRESKWLRLARPYAGDTHGLHLPLIEGTEVAIAFEQGDPDRPYIAHALHDSQHPDHINLYNEKRNILRTPANNKLRMDDTRGQEHIKLSTEHSGKSQLNLGHLVDAERKPRGQGAELRTDGHAAIRAGSGVFISADTQTKAQGQMLEMAPAMDRLKQAGEQLKTLSRDAQTANADPADVYAQLSSMREQLDQLQASVLLLSAPQGIALTSGKHLQLAAQNNLMLNAGGQADISVVKRLFMGVGQGLSLFVNKLGIKMIANQGPISVQAQNDTLELIARHGLHITSTEDEIHITAKKKITLNGGGSYLTLDPSRIEAGTEGDCLVKSAYFGHKKKAMLPARLPPMPQAINPPLTFDEQFQVFHDDGEQPKAVTRYTISSASGQTWKGTTDSQGFTQRVFTASEEKLSLEYDLEEEEEEEELEGITLRLGLFFDGTGNNLANAAVTEQCRREDLKLFTQSELASIVEVCNKYGFDQFDGSGFDSTPDTSYGNAPSNVVHLHRLYPDHATDGLPAGAEIGYVPIYLEGIGTNSDGDDSTYGLGTGQGETGVVARVEQAPAVVRQKMLAFAIANPDTTIRRIEFDIFGFSRGAAAARHCANELLKSGHGVFAGLLKGGSLSVLASFDPAKDVSLNLIGLFDTVAAIGDIGRGDFFVSDDNNPGVNLHLPPGCARQVIQLRARDECRNNFSLNSVQGTHREITLPGVHSDIGGGYLPLARERLWLTEPCRLSLKVNRPVESSAEWVAASAQAQALRASGLAGEGSIEVKAWPIVQPHRGKGEQIDQDYWLVTVLDRPMRGELALVGLRLMRELGLRHGVPFDDIDDENRNLKLTDELQPIAAHILEQALAGTEVSLDAEQERLLRSRYIHQSAHWTPYFGLMAHKPARNNIRNVYPNHPQKGYPQ
jgi:type VI secretion system secreted protein VgrG